MKILMFFPGQIDHLPPLMTAASCMSDLGAEVHLVSTSSEKESIDYLSRHNVSISLVNQSPKSRSKLYRVINRFRVGINFIRAKIAFKPDCIWFHGPFAMEYALIPFILNNCIIVAHAHELCDTEIILGPISRLIPRKANLVLSPEENRLWMLKVTSRSKAIFKLVPNRPNDDMLPGSISTNITKKIFTENGGSSNCDKFIIYQGAFMHDRCLDNVIYAFRKLPYLDTGLILMGGDPQNEYVAHLINLSKSDNRIVFLSRIPPPKHLEVTSGCIGGILLYAPNKLNNIYCAPNKIYEYASMGLGMVLPKYPGLDNLVSKFNIGITCNPLDINSIFSAITGIANCPTNFYRNTTENFLSTTQKPIDNYSEIFNLLSKLKAS